MKAFFKIIVLILSITKTLAIDLQEGYAVIKQDTLFGQIKINFHAGSVIVKQDSINRMFFANIKSVTYLNENRDTFYSYQINGKNKFFKALVKGSNPLIEEDGILYCVIEDYPTVIIEKTLYQLFGKKKVKEYSFVRNISLNNRSGLVDLFSYFNSYIDL